MYYFPYLTTIYNLKKRNIESCTGHMCQVFVGGRYKEKSYIDYSYTSILLQLLNARRNNTIAFISNIKEVLTILCTICVL